MSDAAEIEAVLFKEVGGGYVFQAPNPWVFGPRSRYLVTAAQKAELLAIITPRRPILKIVLITAGILLWAVAASTIVWAVSSHDDPTAGDAIAMFVLIVVPIFLALVVALQRNLRRMRCILAAAPRTEERITSGELRCAMANAMSFKRSLIIGALWTVTCLAQVFTLVIRNAQHPLLSDVQSWLNAFTGVVAAGLAAYYLVIAVRKIAPKQTAS
jgi:NADH:ubiquinone oxidoreductase subunit K